MGIRGPFWLKDQNGAKSEGMFRGRISETKELRGTKNKWVSFRTVDAPRETCRKFGLLSFLFAQINLERISFGLKLAVELGLDSYSYTRIVFLV